MASAIIKAIKALIKATEGAPESMGALGKIVRSPAYRETMTSSWPDELFEGRSGAKLRRSLARELKEEAAKIKNPAKSGLGPHWFSKPLTWEDILKAGKADWQIGTEFMRKRAKEREGLEKVFEERNLSRLLGGPGLDFGNMSKRFQKDLAAFMAPAANIRVGNLIQSIKPKTRKLSAAEEVDGSVFDNFLEAWKDRNKGNISKLRRKFKKRISPDEFVSSPWRTDPYPSYHDPSLNDYARLTFEEQIFDDSGDLSDYWDAKEKIEKTGKRIDLRVPGLHRDISGFERETAAARALPSDDVSAYAPGGQVDQLIEYLQTPGSQLPFVPKPRK